MLTIKSAAVNELCVGEREGLSMVGKSAPSARVPDRRSEAEQIAARRRAVEVGHRYFFSVLTTAMLEYGDAMA